jgi:secreted trypsin-like serine protease
MIGKSDRRHHRHRLFRLLLNWSGVLWPAAVAVCVSLATPAVSLGIVGGHQAAPATQLFMAHIERPIPSMPRYVGLCSGTLIAHNVVLTAGHCVTTTEGTRTVLPARDFTVRTGSVNWTSSNARTSRVARVILDPSYNPSTDYADTALLVLSAPVKMPTIALNNQYQSLDAAGTHAYIMGWGNTHAGQQSATLVLHWAPTVVGCEGDPSPFYSPFELCAADTPTFATSPCYGDSGGPLVAIGPKGQPIEIGVIDRGTSVTCETGDPQVFATTFYLLPWIAQAVGVS